MRTVWLHFAESDQQKLARSLGEIAAAQEDAPWIYPSLDNPIIYIGLSSGHLELSPEARAEFNARIGRLPSASVYLDVSGRVSGREEVRALTQQLLSRHLGLAHDEHSTHLWSLDEIRGDAEVADTRFFSTWF